MLHVSQNTALLFCKTIIMLLLRFLGLLTQFSQAEVSHHLRSPYHHPRKKKKKYNQVDF